MNRQALKSPMTDDDQISPRDAASNQTPSDALAEYLGNLNKLRDIYIDSSVFRNPTWEVFLSLHIKRQAGLQVSPASLCLGNRLSEADCDEAIERLVGAGLIQLEDNRAGNGSQIIDLTEQGQQRMAAFLSIAQPTQA